MSGLVTAVVGTRPAPRTVGPVTQTDVVRFAGAGGDFNPLHHDPEAATTAGFERPIAMGQLTAGLLAAWLTDWCGVEHLRELSVRFTAPLRLGDVVEVAGEVTSVDDGLAVLELSVVRDGTAVLAGSATVQVRTG
ncbi:MAG: MaoC protein dehydratase [Frankiales bacterium]|nr:MaoC protein dehydratase [Frankiales bacterium]